MAEAGSGTNSSGRGEAYLGKGSKVVGTLSFSGPAELDCTVEGEVHSKESLILGDSCVINGKVHGTEVTVRGTVNGDVHASKRLVIKRPAKVIGNISAPSLSVEEGVHFEGKCSMPTTQTSSPSLSAVGGTKSSGAAA